MPVAGGRACEGHGSRIHREIEVMKKIREEKNIGDDRRAHVHLSSSFANSALTSGFCWPAKLSKHN
jgi:hypothetical protein